METGANAQTDRLVYFYLPITQPTTRQLVIVYTFRLCLCSCETFQNKDNPLIS